MSVLERQCKFCEYWEQDIDRVLPKSNDGVCKRFPPTMLTEENIYPVTSSCDWCGEYKTKEQALLDVPILHADYLSVRTMNALEYNSETYLGKEINTLWDLIQYSEKDLLKIRGIGKTCIREIRRSLSAYCATLKGDPQ